MSYIKYDEFGVKEIQCMNCGAPVAMRTVKTIQIKSIPPKTVNVFAMKQLSSWRRRKYILDDGSYMEIILCNECVDLPIAPEKIERALEKGWDGELRQAKKSDKEIQAYIKKLPKIERDEAKIQAYKKASMGRL
jgi:hypothetical protein